MRHEAARHSAAVVNPEPPKIQRRRGRCPDGDELAILHLDISPGAARAVLLVARSEVDAIARPRERLDERALTVRPTLWRAGGCVDQSQSFVILSHDCS